MNTLMGFFLAISLVMFVIGLFAAQNMFHQDEFLYAIGFAFILPLAFFMLLSSILAFHIGAVVFEPMMLAVWEQPSRFLRFLWTYLPRILWALVCRVGPLGAALLIGARHPYRDLCEATGLRSIATTDASPRFTHLWVTGTSPQILYH